MAGTCQKKEDEKIDGTFLITTEEREKEERVFWT